MSVILNHADKFSRRPAISSAIRGTGHKKTSAGLTIGQDNHVLSARDAEQRGYFS